ncbi:MAG: hypothetical protein ABF651_07095 [Sporolactobacillus sp.]
MPEYKYNSIKITDEVNFQLSDKVYAHKYVEDKQNFNQISINLGTGNKRFRILHKLDNSENGAQGFAIASVDNQGNVDTSHIIIAYRGTEGFGNNLDRETDVQQVVEGKHQFTRVKEYIPEGRGVRTVNETIDSQFTSGLKFYDSLKKDYPHSVITTMGHSLGGAMAQYTAAERNIAATTFAAPNTYKLLDDKTKKKVKDGYFRRTIVDYTHKNDLVGKFAEFSQQVGSQYIIKANGTKHPYYAMIGIAGHFQDTFYNMFSSDGSVKLDVSPEKIRSYANHLDHAASSLTNLTRALVDYEDEEWAAIKSLKRRLIHETYHGEKYDLLSENDIIDEMSRLASGHYGGKIYLHDEKLFEQAIHKFQKEKADLDDLAGYIADAGNKLQEKDREVAQTFTLH